MKKKLQQISQNDDVENKISIFLEKLFSLTEEYLCLLIQQT